MEDFPNKQYCETCGKLWYLKEVKEGDQRFFCSCGKCCRDVSDLEDEQLRNLRSKNVNNKRIMDELSEY